MTKAGLPRASEATRCQTRRRLSSALVLETPLGALLREEMRAVAVLFSRHVPVMRPKRSQVGELRRLAFSHAHPRTPPPPPPRPPADEAPFRVFLSELAAYLGVGLQVRHGIAPQPVASLKLNRTPPGCVRCAHCAAVFR